MQTISMGEVQAMIARRVVELAADACGDICAHVEREYGVTFEADQFINDLAIYEESHVFCGELDMDTEAV